MNKRTFYTLLWLLWFVCGLSALGLLFGALGVFWSAHYQKFLLFLLTVISGYAASYLQISRLKKPKWQRRQFRANLAVFWLIYLLILLDFTLVDESLGRNFFHVFQWDHRAYSDFFQKNTNLIPFATIRLFVHAYRRGLLSLIPVAENLLGNLLAFMPMAFFLPCLYPGCNGKNKIVGIAFLFSIVIEMLQFLLMTGSPDVDDVLLNAGGVLLCYLILQNRKIGRRLSKLTFGVWKTVESKDQ